MLTYGHKKAQGGTMKPLRKLAVLLACLLLVTQASAQVIIVPVNIFPSFTSAAPGRLHQIRSVAVISAIGESLTLVNVHALSANATRKIDITGWKLDDAKTIAIKAGLSAQYTIRDVPHDRKALAALEHGGGSEAAIAFLRQLPRPN